MFLKGIDVFLLGLHRPIQSGEFDPTHREFHEFPKGYLLAAAKDYLLAGGGLGLLHDVSQS
jgi:hypothetical protein